MSTISKAKKFASGCVAGLAMSILTAGAAWAAPIVTVQAYSTQGPGNQAGISFAESYAANTPAGATWAEDPTVVPPPGTIGGVYKSPFDSNTLTGTRSYFSVGGVSQPDGDGSLSPNTLSFAQGEDRLSILWGSIDTYNTLTFITPSSQYSFTGTAIMALLNATFGTNFTPTNGNYEKVALINFVFPRDELFTALKFESSLAAFEFAFVPAPAAIGLLGFGLVALGLMRRRHANA